MDASQFNLNPCGVTLTGATVAAVRGVDGIDWVDGVAEVVGAVRLEG